MTKPHFYWYVGLNWRLLINSTRQGHAIAGYEVKLHDTPSLLHLANHQQSRVIDDISAEIHSGSVHSDWLLEQGYLSSFTVPIIRQNQFLALCSSIVLKKTALL